MWASWIDGVTDATGLLMKLGGETHMKKNLSALLLATAILMSGATTVLAAEMPVAGNAVEIAVTQSMVEWKSNSSYKIGDKVVYEGKIYECIVDHSRLKPTTKYVWKCIGDYKIAPEWVKGQKYIVGDEVSYEGHIYKCIVDHVKLKPTTQYVWKLVK